MAVTRMGHFESQTNSSADDNFELGANHEGIARYLDDARIAGVNPNDARRFVARRQAALSDDLPDGINPGSTEYWDGPSGQVKNNPNDDAGGAF